LGNLCGIDNDDACRFFDDNAATNHAPLRNGANVPLSYAGSATSFLRDCY